MKVFRLCTIIVISVGLLMFQDCFICFRSFIILLFERKKEKINNKQIIICYVLGNNVENFVTPH